MEFQIQEVSIVKKTTVNGKQDIVILCSKDLARKYKSPNDEKKQVAYKLAEFEHSSISKGNDTFHAISKKKMVYICKTDSEYPRNLAYDCLNQIIAQFEKQFDSRQIEAAIANAFDKTFGQVLENEIKRFNKPDADKLRNLKNKTETALDITIQNLDQTLKRTENLKNVVDNSSNQNVTSIKFKNDAKDLHNKMWWRNKRWMLFLILIVILAIYLLVSFICGFKFDKC